MSDNFLNLEKSTLEPLFKMADVPFSENIDENAVKEALSALKQKFDMAFPEMNSENGENFSHEEFQKELSKSSLGKKRSILIVDDIGVVTYQLKILFQKKGLDVETAKDIFNAIKLIKNKKFDFIVMDLFVSTEREGYLLLDETKKIIIQYNLNTKIVIITASNKGEHKVKCLNRGANMFLQKDIGWQEELMKFVEEN